jgi:hypothetical protein
MTHRPWLFAATLILIALAALLRTPATAAGPKPLAYWQVDEVRPGMKGYGVSVFKGSKIERFDVEVLGVLKNTSPGRDLVLVRVSGCDLEKTGVIAGMSGSPVYIDGKLLGAIAYAWAFGKEPIAGVTPFCQMVEYVESFERRDLTSPGPERRVHLDRPVRAGGRDYHAVTVSPRFDPVPTSADDLYLVPLRTPLAASGYTQHSLELLKERTGWAGMVPMQAGAAPAHVRNAVKATPLEPGSPLAVALVIGDFDLSGIGTVTHIDGDRVYGWGHPFLSLGQCEFPLMSGYIHTIYPRQSVSFKIGSPVHLLGTINADVSTCIAGYLGREPDLMPLRMTVRREPAGTVKTFTCRVVRQKALLPQLVYTTLTNSIDMEGELPEELTAEMETRFEFEDRPPLVIRDTYSGPSYSGGRAPAALYSQVAALAQTLVNNPFQTVRIKSITCDTRLAPGRQSADIEAVQLDSETYAPGETLRATVYVKPYRGTPQRVAVQLPLPAHLPEGTYTAQICDDLTNVRQQIRESVVLSSPTNLEQVFDVLAVQASVKRTHLVVRVPLSNTGVTLDGQPLPDLPASMVEMLANSKRTGAQTMTGALASRHPTPWVIHGSQSVKFTVTKHKRLTVAP